CQAVGRDIQGMIGRQKVQQRHGDEDHQHQQADGQRDPWTELGAGAGENGLIQWHGHQSITLPFSANRPCGRFWMNRMISARIRILPSTAPICGSRNLFTTPRPKAASTLPASWPTPPSTTTRKESMM